MRKYKTKNKYTKCIKKERQVKGEITSGDCDWLIITGPLGYKTLQVVEYRNSQCGCVPCTIFSKPYCEVPE